MDVCGPNQFKFAINPLLFNLNYKGKKKNVFVERELKVDQIQIE